MPVSRDSLNERTLACLFHQRFCVISGFNRFLHEVSPEWTLWLQTQVFVVSLCWCLETMTQWSNILYMD